MDMCSLLFFKILSRVVICVSPRNNSLYCFLEIVPKSSQINTTINALYSSDFENPFDLVLGVRDLMLQRDNNHFSQLVHTNIDQIVLVDTTIVDTSTGSLTYCNAFLREVFHKNYDDLVDDDIELLCTLYYNWRDDIDLKDSIREMRDAFNDLKICHQIKNSNFFSPKSSLTDFDQFNVKCLLGIFLGDFELEASKQPLNNDLVSIYRSLYMPSELSTTNQNIAFSKINSIGLILINADRILTNQSCNVTNNKSSVLLNDNNNFYDSNNDFPVFFLPSFVSSSSSSNQSSLKIGGFEQLELGTLTKSIDGVYLNKNNESDDDDELDYSFTSEVNCNHMQEEKDDAMDF